MADTNKMRDDLPSMVEQAITEHPGYPEFAAWCESQLVHPYTTFFLIWQASREAVVVKLPDAWDSDRGWIIDRDETREAIEAVGLKVAP